MSRAQRDMDGLAQLSDMIFAARQLEMRALRTAEAALRTRLAALDADRHARGLSVNSDDPALIAGADLLWHGWIDARRVALNATLAQNLGAQEIARAGLVQAFGRMQASRSLAQTARQDRARDVASRRERGF